MILSIFAMPVYDRADQNDKLLVDTVINTFRLRYPEWMAETIDPYFADTREQQAAGTFNFSALDGETQQGKALVMHLLSWILIYREHYVPCYITKKISSLRDDAMVKMNHGAVNKIVNQVARDLGLGHLAKSFHLQGSLGLRYADTKRGTVPIYLMEPKNNVRLLKWMQKVINSVGGYKYLVFIFDEVQELYTGKSVNHYLSKKALAKIERGNLGNHHLIHMVMDLCKQKRCAMIGITATPQRMLCSDPEVYPDRLYKIPCRPPVPGLKRVGYTDDSDEFQGAEFHAETDPVKVVQQILSREPVTLSNGQRQVKFLNIITESFNDDMGAIHQILTENFGQDQIYARLFIQDNKDYNDINIRDLDHFFDLRHVPEQVISNGVMVLIGKSREGAGITIKPSFKMDKESPEDCYYNQTVVGSSWTINGITDMMVKLTGNMEGTEQLIGRATGWYDPNHVLHMWLPEAHIHDVRTGLILTKRSMIRQFREGLGTARAGPLSVLKVSNMCTKITDFTPNKLYTGNGTRRGNITTGDSVERPITVGDLVTHELQTETYEMSELVSTEFKEVIDAKLGGNSSEARSVRQSILGELGEALGAQVPNHIQLPWTTARKSEIIKAVAQPRGDSQWKVNGYGVLRPNADGEERLHIIMFQDRYNSRSCFGYQCSDCDQGSCPHHVSINDNICWREVDRYQSATYTRVMEHKYATAIQNWSLDTVTQRQVIAQIDELVRQCHDAIRKKNLYNLFTRMHTLAGFNSRRPTDVRHQTWISGLWSKFKNDFSELHQTLEAQLRSASAGEEEELLSDFEKQLEPYFRVTFRPIHALPAPVVRIRPQLRLRVAPVQRLRPRLRAVPAL
jgi:hypothetical protein